MKYMNGDFVCACVHVIAIGTQSGRLQPTVCTRYHVFRYPFILISRAPMQPHAAAVYTTVQHQRYNINSAVKISAVVSYLQAAFGFVTATRSFFVHACVLCSPGPHRDHFGSKAEPSTVDPRTLGRLMPGSCTCVWRVVYVASVFPFSRFNTPGI